MEVVADSPTVTVPHLFGPRERQIPFLAAMDAGKDRACLVWHRRYGKDTVCWNYMIKEAVEKVGNYYYFFPTYKQGRMVIWDGRGKDGPNGEPGTRFLDHIPEELMYSPPNKSEMKITLKHPTIKGAPGSIIQIIGLDKFDSKMGTNPRGCVFSEYSLQNPAAWAHIRPILRENKGWAVFNFTPRGENHAYELYQMAQNNPKWFCELLTIDDTNVLTPADIQEERDSGMSEDMIEQEFFCSFTAANDGAFYGKQMKAAQEGGRFKKIDYDPDLNVDTYWDLGVNDANSIWFVQTLRSPREVRVIDFYQNTDEGLQHYLNLLQGKALEFGYVYGSHWAPHDIKVREYTTGTSRIDTARKMGINFQIVPNESIQDGIEAVRQIIPMCWFDEEKCRDGILALKSYHKSWDDIHKVYRNTPQHDWSSNPADAFRYMAIAHKVNEIKTNIRHRIVAGTLVTKYKEADPFARRREGRRTA